MIVDRKERINKRLTFILTEKIMLASHVKLSSKGQIVIPKAIRESLHWDTGAELTLVASESGVILQARQKKTKLDISSLRGMLENPKISLSTEELCQPVDYDIDKKEALK